MVLRLGIFARAQTEEHENMDKVNSALGELAGWVGCCLAFQEESKGGSLISMGRGILVSKVPEHAGEMLIEIS